MPSENGIVPQVTSNSDVVGGASGAKSQCGATNDQPRKTNHSSSESHITEAGSLLLNGSAAAPHKSTKSRQMQVIDIKRDLSALVAQQMLATPDAIALEDETTKLTYSELDQRVTALANRLRDHGVGRDNLVGVLLGRSANYVIACLAALRAGGAFLVLELAYPPNLLADVIDDAKPTVVITNSTQANQFNADIPLILLDELGTDPYKSTEPMEGLSPLPADDDLERLAFVSYSSGTTGRPKGIANPHMAPVLSYDLRFRLSDLSTGDRVACNVFFVWEILRPLLRGATVFCVPDEASYDPVALVDLLSRQRITETLMTPTLLAAVLSRHPDIESDLPDLRTLWFNGEVVTTDLARRAMKALPKTRLLNCYSASETHEIACGDIREIIDEEAPYCPVGQPMEPEHTYILDASGNKVETGVAGELFVGGSLLARGYLNLPETTAEAFVPNPFDATPGSRMYRTGDLAKMLPSGVLEITGRVGAMIKVRGYSVVPGKVENAIIEKLAVKQCAVIAHGDGLDRQLVAYIVHDKEDPGHRAIPIVDEAGYSLVARRTLSTSLAQYMIPALWVELDELPTNRVSGKADIKKLPPPVVSISTIFNHTKTERDPRINTEAIAEIWAASLNVPFNSVTKEHTFFDLGGHSLTLADLATRLSREFGFLVPVARLVVNPTLQGHLDVVLAVRDGHTAAVQADLPAVLRADCTLPESIQPAGNPVCSLEDAHTVLLTGATGFLGAFILCDLLESTSARILCLVRFTDPKGEDAPAGVARIRKNLLDLGLWKDSILDRIEVLPGNLSHKRLGLGIGAYKELVDNVQVIIHAAATVNLVYPYAALRDANVGGTRKILRLAGQSGATLQYISTNGVLPPSEKAWPESSMIGVEAVPESLVDGYGQTKYVAEELVHEAGRRGMPVRILRCGTISGHSTSGSTNTYDLFTALLVESLHLGYYPDIAGWRAEMTPVDHVSKAITTISNDIQTKQRVFHLGDSNPVETKSLFDNLAELGYPAEPLEWEKWVSLWTQKRGSAKRGAGAFTADILRGGMPTVEFLKDITMLGDDESKTVLGALQRPKIDVKLLETYARNWYARGWLPRQPLRLQQLNGAGNLPKKGPLSGLVAVVTGASSGIGAATAAALAKEGAHVALAARRTEALESLKKMITTYGGKVLVHQTDVTKKEQVESLVRATEETLGPVDIFVSCAGVMYFTMMANVQTEDWERTVDVNCKGLLNCLSSTVPSMLSRGKGHIVAISSDAGRKVFPGLGVYSASKFFVEATLQGLRVETAGTGLRVTSIQPGNVATELLSMSTDAEALKKYGEPSGAKVLDPEDVANMIVYTLRQPEHVAVNEVMIEPRDEPI
ncbi:putative NRPS-like protein biosynthetic cluster [Pseudogymnoascus verrucosus]|uniref:Putative NRPS-like protein biosynthetic cluster n=1 Tax=Pseudogymnoascus verrucosus TaxID=342668 RepID=A0A1B8GE03_9PEZI|nr:putative NRPS-like protein biosynthetic cluster [Pseudogymnoascus verrucosus]OBT94058.1 putative NRPS-like protein biosynthetic cluster [Pseudogymnoascus verrucosus]